MQSLCVRVLIHVLFCSLFHRKSTFDIFNFLASQHRQLPDIGPYDDEEDEVLLKSTRSEFPHFDLFKKKEQQKETRQVWLQLP